MGKEFEVAKEFQADSNYCLHNSDNEKKSHSSIFSS